MTQDEQTSVAVEPWRLDDFAAECGRAVAPVFEEKRWVWHERIPDAAQIAVRLRMLIAEVQVGHSLGTGRLTVHRYLDDCDDEVFDVSLEVGRIYANEHH